MKYPSQYIVHIYSLIIISAISWILVQELKGAEVDLKGKMAFSTQSELQIITLDNKRSWKEPLAISLPNKGDLAHHPDWMPDGENIIFEFSPWTDDINNMEKYFAVINVAKTDVTTLQVELFDRNDNLMYPKWSPNGTLLAFLENVDSEVVKDEKGNSIVINFSKVVVFNKATSKTITFDKVFARWSPLSWASDSQKIAYQTSDGEIAVIDLTTNKTIILDKGSYPIFHPKTNHLFYIGLDTYLYRTDIDGNNRRIINTSDWSWFSLIGFSNNGDNLFYIGGGSFFLTEYRSIDVFNLKDGKRKRISKKYGIIHGASLYEH